MDKFLDAWASYCDGTSADAASMVLFYLATHYPECYVKNVKKKLFSEEDIVEFSKNRDDVRRTKRSAVPVPIELPLDYVSYDGTSQIMH